MSYDTNLRAAVRDLIAAKGRYHTGIEYARLVAAFNADAVGRAITDPIDSIDYKLMFDRCVAEKQALLEIAKRSETISDTSNMTRFDSSMTREQIAEKMRRAIKPDPIYDARCALQDRTDWSAS